MRITAGRMEGWAGDCAAVMCTVDTATGVCCCCWSIASVSEQLRRVCASWPCNVGRPRPIDRCCHSVLLASSPADQRTYPSSTTQSLPSNTRRLAAIVRNSVYAISVCRHAPTICSYFACPRGTGSIVVSVLVCLSVRSHISKTTCQNFT